jgi:hypothetical protein
VLPNQSDNLPEAANEVLNELDPKVLLQFDESFQGEVLDPLGGLWDQVSGTGDLTKTLKDELQRRARSVILESLQDIDAARLFFESQRGSDQAVQVWLAHVQAALPRLVVREGWQQLILMLPKSQDGALLGDIVTQRFPDAPGVRLDSDGDVIVCREAAQLPIHQAAVALFGNGDGYADNAKRVMTRVDITWSALSSGAIRHELALGET